MKAITLGRLRLTRSGGSPDGRDWRGRAPLAVLVAVCVGVVGIAVSGAGQSVPGVRFLQSGHWVFNSKLGTVALVNGQTKQIEQTLPGIDAPAGSSVVQTDTKGYVLSRSGSQEFGKSDLTVRPVEPDEVDEQPVGLEAPGIAYSIKQQAGVVVRFGEHRIMVRIGGPLGRPAYTPDGTLWLHRLDTGQVCELAPDADTVTCPAKAAAGPRVAITVVGDQPVLVDTAARTMAVLSRDGLGRAKPFDVPLDDDAIVAANDVDGRVPVLEPGSRRVHLIDASNVVGDRPAAPPETVQLPKGRYAGVASSGKAVAVVDQDSGTLHTYDGSGKERASQQFPEASGKKVAQGKEDELTLFRGEDEQLYADSRTGEHVMVVDDDGGIATVDARGTDEDVDSDSDKKGSRLKETDKAKDNGKSRQNKPDRPVEPPRREPTEQPTEQPTEEPTEEPTTEDPGRDEKPDKQNEKPRTNKPQRQAARVPDAPGNVRATAGDKGATIRWNGADGNGADVREYEVGWTGGRTTVPGTQREVTVGGLTNGTGYSFTVRARNRVGTGPGSTSAAVTPAGKVTAASAPRQLSIVPSDEALDVEWKRPDLHGGTLLYYQVTIEGFADPRRTTATSASYDTLENERTYTITVRAITRAPDGRTLTGAAATGKGRPTDADAVPKVDVWEAEQTGFREVTLSAFVYAGGQRDLTCHVHWEGSSTVRDLPCQESQDDDRELVVKNLPRAGTYTFWMTGTNSLGTGKRGVSHSVTIDDGAVVRVSRGPDTTYEDTCGPPDCSYMHMKLTGFEPNTEYDIRAHSTKWPNYNSVSLSTDGNGYLEFNRFPFEGEGQKVWVTVHTTAGDQLAESNHYTWAAR